MSLARAANLAGKSLGEFIELLRSKHTPRMEYAEASLNDDIRAIKELSGEYAGKQE